MASVAHRIKIQILFSGNLGPVFAGLADGSFAVLPCSLSRLRSSCQALLRPLCHGFAVTAGGSLAALPQILGFPGSLKSYPASFASQPCLPPLLQESVVVAGLFASEAAEQGCTVGLTFLLCCVGDCWPGLSLFGYRLVLFSQGSSMSEWATWGSLGTFHSPEGQFL